MVHEWFIDGLPSRETTTHINNICFKLKHRRYLCWFQPIPRLNKIVNLCHSWSLWTRNIYQTIRKNMKRTPPKNLHSPSLHRSSIHPAFSNSVLTAGAWGWWFMVIHGDSWWLYGDFMVIDCNWWWFMVIDGDFMVILWWLIVIDGDSWWLMVTLWWFYGDWL